MALLFALALPVVHAGEEFGLSLHLAVPTLAKDSDGGDSGGGSDGEGGSDSGEGSDNSGSGSDNSGHGGGDDGDGEGDGDEGDDGEDDGDDADVEADEDDERARGGLLGGGRGGEGGRDSGFREGEVIAYGLTQGERDALSRAGFRPLGDYGLQALGYTITRMRVPLGLGAEEGLSEAERTAPGAVLALNHLYSSRGAPDSEARWPAALVGFGSLSNGACSDAPTIAIIDTGVNAWHPALQGARIKLQSFVEGPEHRAAAGHGTAISALLVGHGGHQAGPLAPGAELLVAGVFGQDEDTQQADAVAVLRGLDWAIATGAEVIGLSFAGAPNRILELGLAAAAKHADLVAAAGNSGPGGAPAYPAAYPEVIAVAAVDARQRPYRRGTRGAYIDISAPGVGISSADANGGTKAWSGTSFSVPFVMAALLRARAETEGDPAAARALIQERARDLGAPGRDEVYGVGLLQSPGDHCS